MDTTNQKVAELLRRVAAALLIKKENRFRIVAYDKAADVIEQMAKDIEEVWRDGKLDQVPGIGSAIQEHLNEYFKTGKVKHFEHVFKGIPDATFVLMGVPGIGPIKAYKLSTIFKLHNPKTALKDVMQIAKDDKIAHLEGFGSKSQSLIMESVERYVASGQANQRMLLPYASELAASILEHLKKHPAVEKCDVLGSLRRSLPTIGDIDIACVVKDGQIDPVIKHFISYPGKISIDNAGGKKASIFLPPHIRVDLRIESAEGYGAMLQYFTGSKAHNIKLREYALDKGYSLSEWGIKKTSRASTEIMKFSSEEKFYKFIGLPCIEPEIREGTNEIERALNGTLPNLIELTEIKGDLHIHSNYDLKPSHDKGANSFQEMIDKAKELKYDYIGFSEHNPKLSGHGKDEIIDIMKRRHEYIQKTVKGLPYFIGLEVDILPSGELALPEKAIDYVDYLIVSIHSSFTQDKATMTKRVKTGLLYPKVRIFGHPTARLINKRDGIDLDWDEIFDVTYKKNIALEINSSADRLDLPDSLVREGLGHGCKFVVNTDAHAVTQMDTMKYGVSVARRGWLEAKDVVNTYSVGKFKEWLESS